MRAIGGDGAVPFVNLPGMPHGQLRLTGEVLARIFLGKVETWDAPELHALNPGLALPGLKIHPWCAPTARARPITSPTT